MREAVIGAEQLCDLLLRDSDSAKSTRSDFADFLQRSDEQEYAFLVDTIDQSDYSPLDWVDALLGFDAWLTKLGEPRRPLRDMVGYVHCCTMTNSPGINLPSLKVIVSELLIEYGFDAVSGCQK